MAVDKCAYGGSVTAACHHLAACGCRATREDEFDAEYGELKCRCGHWLQHTGSGDLRCVMGCIYQGCADLKAENERLRAVLVLAREFTNCSCPWDVGYATCTRCALRAALEELDPPLDTSAQVG